MSKLLMPSLLAAVVGLGTWLGSEASAGGATPASAETFVARPGDTVRVEGTPIACRIVRVRELDKRVAFDCRRGGPLAGTYGTLLTAREAAIVKFESATTARLVSVARHRGARESCG
jgi:hypothetical protein